MCVFALVIFVLFQEHKEENHPSFLSLSLPCLLLHFKYTHASHIITITLYYIYMSDCENPRFTERTFTNLGRSHRLPHVCTIMIYGKLGGYRLQEAAVFLYIYI